MWHRTLVGTHEVRIEPRKRRVIIDGREVPMHVFHSRCVFMDEDTNLVVKIASGNSHQCFNEARLWKRVEGTTDAVYFAPVLASHHSGTWLVQRLIRSEGYRTWRRVSEVGRVMGKHKLVDLHTGNWVVRDRRVVIVDYGA